MKSQLAVILILLYHCFNLSVQAPVESDINKSQASNNTTAEKEYISLNGSINERLANGSIFKDDDEEKPLTTFLPSTATDNASLAETSTFASTVSNYLNLSSIKGTVNETIPEITNGTSEVPRNSSTATLNGNKFKEAKNDDNKLPNSTTVQGITNNPNNNSLMVNASSPTEPTTTPKPLQVPPKPTLPPIREIVTSVAPYPNINDFDDNETFPDWHIQDRYKPQPLPSVDNKVFKEFTRLSKLTQYMLLDPKFAEDYQKGNLTSLTKVLFVVYGDTVKHMFSSPGLTQSGPPLRKSRIRYRVKSLNDKPPKQCSELGRETMRLFCPFSYGYRWWDCLMPDEVCDGIPHCGLGDDEDPKMCLYFKAAMSLFERSQKSLEAAQSRQEQQKERKKPKSRVVMYDPIDE